MPLPTSAALASSISTSLVARGVGGSPSGQNLWLLMIQLAAEALQPKILQAFTSALWVTGAAGAPPVVSEAGVVPGVGPLAFSAAASAVAGAPATRSRSYAAEAGFSGAYGASIPHAIAEGCLRAWRSGGLLRVSNTALDVAWGLAPYPTVVGVSFPRVWAPDAAAVVQARWDSEPRLRSPVPAGRAATATLVSKVVLDSVSWLRPTVIVGTPGGIGTPPTAWSGATIV